MKQIKTQKPDGVKILSNPNQMLMGKKEIKSFKHKRIGMV